MSNKLGEFSGESSSSSNPNSNAVDSLALTLKKKLNLNRLPSVLASSESWTSQELYDYTKEVFNGMRTEPPQGFFRGLENLQFAALHEFFPISDQTEITTTLTNMGIDYTIAFKLSHKIVSARNSQIPTPMNVVVAPSLPVKEITLDTLLDDKYKSPIFPLIPPFPIRRKSVEDSILYSIHDTIGAIEEAKSNNKPVNRGKFVLFQIATMSGMGKTSFGFQLVKNLQNRIDELKSKLNLDKLSKALEHSKVIFIDFNGFGDAINTQYPVDMIDPLLSRVVARGWLNTSIEMARLNQDFCSKEGSFDWNEVLNRIFERHRFEQKIPDTEHAVLFLHIDEIQLAHKAIYNELVTAGKVDKNAPPPAIAEKAIGTLKVGFRAILSGYNAKEANLERDNISNGNNKIKNNSNNNSPIYDPSSSSITSTSSSIPSASPKIISSSSSAASSSLSSSVKGRNIVSILVSGTSTAHLKVEVTEFGWMPLNFEALSLDSSLLFLRVSIQREGKSRWHQDWFVNLEFRRLVADLGGLPQLLNELLSVSDNLEIPYIDDLLGQSPSDQKSDVQNLMKGIAKALVLRNDVSKHFRYFDNHESKVVLALIRLFLSRTSVPLNHQLGDEPNADATVEYFAQNGVISLTPDKDGQFFVQVPIVSLYKLTLHPHFPIGRLFEFPFDPSAGRAFELGLVCSLSARLFLFSKKTEFTLNSFLGLNIDEVNLGIDLMEKPLQNNCLLVEEEKQLFTKAHECRFQPGEQVAGMDLWTRYKQSIPNNQPHVVFLHCAGTYAFDARVVLTRPNNQRSLMVLFQTKDSKLLAKSQAAKIVNTLFNGCRAMIENNPSMDYLVCLVTSHPTRYKAVKEYEERFNAMATEAITQTEAEKMELEHVKKTKAKKVKEAEKGKKKKVLNKEIEGLNKVIEAFKNLKLVFLDPERAPSLMPAFWHRTESTPSEQTKQTKQTQLSQQHS